MIRIKCALRASRMEMELSLFLFPYNVQQVSACTQSNIGYGVESLLLLAVYKCHVTLDKIIYLLCEAFQREKKLISKSLLTFICT